MLHMQKRLFLLLPQGVQLYTVDQTSAFKVTDAHRYYPPFFLPWTHWYYGRHRKIALSSFHLGFLKWLLE